ncbi:MAG: cell division topological specificity factor MinE [Anaerolineaceae bacterium 4572_5.1]|nr:MAG: cell division topological specificity factor MinE [Anaerolineaceae bacterium 4572_5.1]RLD07887.1 MAG: cell division topological specificity factor MinE [Chloroflexota bacterium]
MSNFLDQLFSRKSSSASQAKDRLQLVLINDRTALTPQAMENLKDDLLEVLSRYIKIDSRAVKIDLTSQGRQQRLIADIPITGPQKRKR